LLTTLSQSRDEVDPRSLYTNNFTSYINGYKYAFDRSLKLEEQATFLFSEKNILVTGISYEDITALPKTGDMPFPFNRDLAADFQNIYYLGTNIYDRDGNDLSIPQDFYYLQYQNLGAYLQWRSILADKLSLTLGGRLDFNTRYNTTINPRAGLVYSPTGKLKIKVLYGKAYLSPSPYRQYQHYGSFQPATDPTTNEVIGLQSGFWRLPGIDLQSQKISTYETSGSYVLKSNIIFTLNGFYNDVDDILSSATYTDQSFKGVPVSIIERPINKGNTFSYGGTASLALKKSWESFTLNSFLAYTYIDGEINGRQIPFTAKNTVKATIDLNFKRFSASTRLIYRSESYHRSNTDDNGNLISNDPFAVINMAARYMFVEQERFEFEVFLKISNLLNSRYYNVPLGGAESIMMTPQDPIRIMVGVEFQFK
jgi:iron complex outermembrane receptor protein